MHDNIQQYLTAHRADGMTIVIDASEFRGKWWAGFQRRDDKAIYGDALGDTIEGALAELDKVAEANLADDESEHESGLTEDDHLRLNGD